MHKLNCQYLICQLFIWPTFSPWYITPEMQKEEEQWFLGNHHHYFLEEIILIHPKLLSRLQHFFFHNKMLLKYQPFNNMEGFIVGTFNPNFLSNCFIASCSVKLGIIKVLFKLIIHFCS